MSEEDTLEEALTQEHHRWPGGTRRVCVGGRGFWEQGPGKVPESGAGLDSGSIPWGASLNPQARRGG